MSSNKLAATVLPCIALLAVSFVVSVTTYEQAKVPVSAIDRGVEVRPKHPRFVSSMHPEGNERTVEFLNWAQSKYAPYAYVELDEKGDITRLQVHICYDVTDEELKVIAALPRLERLEFYTTGATDEGLKHLEATNSLRELSIYGFSKSSISELAIHQLKQRIPDLKVTLSW